jgi:fatty aldehyde-generating acyl-ACP reductase
LTRFAFVIHPIHPRDIARKYPIAKFLPDPLIESLMAKKSPEKVSDIRGIESLTGAKTEGIFIGLPLTPMMMVDKLPLEFVYDRLQECAEIAEREGCEVIGLGAFTAVVGDGGKTLDSRTKIAVTTGNSYTVTTAIEGALKAASLLEIDVASATVGVVGATGSIGKTCARVMAPLFANTVLVGRDLPRTQTVADDLPNALATTDFAKLREADVVVTVTSADTAVIFPEHLKTGSVICDVSRPRDVSVRVAQDRPDVLVIEGGVVSVPGDVDFGFDFGFPPKTAYACMSETMILALEGRKESYTIGKDVSVEQVTEMGALAKKHGFTLAGFRSFEKAVSQETIDRVKAARKAPTAV